MKELLQNEINAIKLFWLKKLPNKSNNHFSTLFLFATHHCEMRSMKLEPINNGLRNAFACWRRRIIFSKCLCDVWRVTFPLHIWAKFIFSRRHTARKNVIQRREQRRGAIRQPIRRCLLWLLLWTTGGRTASYSIYYYIMNAAIKKDREQEKNKQKDSEWCYNRSFCVIAYFNADALWRVPLSAAEMCHLIQLPSLPLLPPPPSVSDYYWHTGRQNWTAGKFRIGNNKSATAYTHRLGSSHTQQWMKPMKNRYWVLHKNSLHTITLPFGVHLKEM